MKKQTGKVEPGQIYKMSRPTLDSKNDLIESYYATIERANTNSSPGNRRWKLFLIDEIPGGTFGNRSLDHAWDYEHVLLNERYYTRVA